MVKKAIKKKQYLRKLMRKKLNNNPNCCVKPSEDEPAKERGYNRESRKTPMYRELGDSSIGS